MGENVLFRKAGALLFSLTLAASSCTREEGGRYKFDFGAGAPARGYVKVTPGETYTDEKGYGFDFIPADIRTVERRGSGPAKDFVTTDGEPFYFSVKLPEGNYRVRVTLGDRRGESLTTVRAESRRLMEKAVVTRDGEVVTCEFTLNIRTPLLDDGRTIRLKPREFAKVDWDDRLTLEFTDAHPCVCAVEIERVDDVPTLFLCGDSTVVDQDNEPWAAWGQMLPLFFDAGVSVANFAESGENARSFRGELRWEKLLSTARPGDYVFIQFGHNDTGYRDPFGIYKEAYREYIKEAREKECIPVIVTPMNRRNFTDGVMQTTFADYVEALQALAEEENVALIDLNAISIEVFNAMGEEESKKAFIHFPGGMYEGEPNDRADNTHFSSYGAYELAKCIVEGIKACNLPIVEHIRKDYVAFDPAKPDDVDAFSLPLTRFIQTYDVSEDVQQ